MMKRLLPVQISTLADDEVEVVMSTGAIARDSHVLVPQGVVLDNYRLNPIVLWGHSGDAPIGRASDIRVVSNGITAKITFAPRGISAKADEIRGLMKAGILSCVSVGFEPLDGEPLDPKKPRGGKRFTSWELLELSVVSVPADTGAMVTARELERDEMTEQTRAAEGGAEIVEGSLAEEIVVSVAEPSVIVLPPVAAEDGERAAEPEMTRAGKRLSQATIAAIMEAITHHDNGMRCLRDMLERDDDGGGEMSHEPAVTRDVGEPAANENDRPALLERLRQLRMKR